jgi:oxygen-independent coproporphyrinogen-3 oxidase
MQSEIMQLERLSEKYNEGNIPLYLSYPVQSYWKKQFSKDYLSNKNENQENPFLYFHLPYCKEACYYCACFKAVTQEDEKKDDYIDCLIKEYNQKLEISGVEKYKNIKHLHWGGGTPTYLNEKQIEKLFKSIETRISFASGDDLSISIEGYPDPLYITDDKLKCLSNLGFNEISFGIQDFDKRVQNAINRNTSKQTARQIFEKSKKYGFRTHVDLCYGLPFQGLNEFEDSIKEIISMKPDRIACFTYAHYPLMYPMQRFIPRSALPNSFIRVLLTKLADELFHDANYVKIGYDHFVLKNNSLEKAKNENNAFRDFMGYSVDGRRNLLGFGNSAISFINGNYMQNEIDINKYLSKVKNNELPVTEMNHCMSKDDCIRYDIIQRCLMTRYEIERNEIGMKYQIDFNSYFKNEIEALKLFTRDELIIDDGNRIKVTRIGEYFIRHIAHVFDRYSN